MKLKLTNDAESFYHDSKGSSPVCHAAIEAILGKLPDDITVELRTRNFPGASKWKCEAGPDTDGVKYRIMIIDSSRFSTIRTVKQWLIKVVKPGTTRTIWGKVLDDSSD
jgi:hypothetical protein